MDRYTLFAGETDGEAKNLLFEYFFAELSSAERSGDRLMEIGCDWYQIYDTVSSMIVLEGSDY